MRAGGPTRRLQAQKGGISDKVTWRGIGNIMIINYVFIFSSAVSYFFLVFPSSFISWPFCCALISSFVLIKFYKIICINFHGKREKKICNLLAAIYISRLKEMTEYFILFLGEERKVKENEAVKSLKCDVLLPEIWLGFGWCCWGVLEPRHFREKCQNK